jgi:excinuclease ABC subunit A
MGPEGGERGGKIVDCAPPLKLAKNYKKTGSFTGQFLADEFELK